MASFCRQCSEELFGEYYGDFTGITTAYQWANGIAAVVLCEACGTIQVDPQGNYISKDCMKNHGKGRHLRCPGVRRCIWSDIVVAPEN